MHFFEALRAVRVFAVFSSNDVKLEIYLRPLKALISAGVICSWEGGVMNSG